MRPETEPALERGAAEGQSGESWAIPSPVPRRDRSMYAPVLNDARPGMTRCGVARNAMGPMSQTPPSQL